MQCDILSSMMCFSLGTYIDQSDWRGPLSVIWGCTQRQLFHHTWNQQPPTKTMLTLISPLVCILLVNLVNQLVNPQDISKK